VFKINSLTVHLAGQERVPNIGAESTTYPSKPLSKVCWCDWSEWIISAVYSPPRR